MNDTKIVNVRKKQDKLDMKQNLIIKKRTNLVNEVIKLKKKKRKKKKKKEKI